MDVEMHLKFQKTLLKLCSHDVIIGVKVVTTIRFEQNGRHVADDILKHIFLRESCLKF